MKIQDLIPGLPLVVTEPDGNTAVVVVESVKNASDEGPGFGMALRIKYQIASWYTDSPTIRAFDRPTGPQSFYALLRYDGVHVDQMPGETSFRPVIPSDWGQKAYAALMNFAKAPVFTKAA